jgi:hypothetical protein
MMNWSRFLLILPAVACMSCAQYIKVTATKTILPQNNEEYTISGISPDNKDLLVCKPYYTGLYLINIRNGQTSTVTNLPGTGYQPAFSSDGRYLLYRSDDFSEKKRYSTIYKLDLATGDTDVLVRKGRNVSPPVVVGKDIAYSIDGREKTTGFDWKFFGHPIEKTYVQLEDLTPVLWTDGIDRKFKPGGEGSYIWVSLSPNRKMMVYYLVGKGAFVCDLRGRTLLSAGDLKNPGWLGNKYITGVAPHNGSAISTVTDVVAFSVKTGQRTVLTNTPQVNERNPIPSQKGRHIAFQTTTGALKVIKIKKR